MNPDSTGKQLIVATPACPIVLNVFYEVTWSPNGDRIAYGCDGGPVRIANSDTGTILREFNIGQMKHPAWSPTDENKIAFVTNAEPPGHALGFRIWIADIIFPQTPTFTVVSPDAFGENPEWSPDGEWIIYNLINSGGLRLTHVTGGTQYVLTNQADFEPSWSPDGTKITFRRGTGDSGNLIIANISTNPVALSNEIPFSANVIVVPPQYASSVNFLEYSEFRPDWGDAGCSGGFAALMDGEGGPICQVPTETPTYTPTATFTPTSTPTPNPNNVIYVNTLSISSTDSNTNGDCTLIEAIQRANGVDFDDCEPTELDLSVAGHVIKLPAGDYILNEDLGNGNGLPIVNSTILVKSTDGQSRTIRRNPTTFQFRIFEVTAEGSLTLDNIIVSGGSIQGNGGGIYNLGNLIIRNNSKVESNRSINNGGGIYNAGTLLVQDSVIQRNVGKDGSGGGVFSTTTASATLTNSCIVFNTARTDGGIHAETPANVNVQSNWWGDKRGPTDIGLQADGFGDVVTPDVNYNINDPLKAPPPNVNGCIDYSDIYFNNPHTKWGQPGLAGEIYVRARQIMGREPHIKEIFAFILNDAGVPIFATQLRKDRLTEAIARKFYRIDRQIFDECLAGAIHMAQLENINPSTDDSNLIQNPHALLCTLGATEWYGEVTRAEEQAYRFVDMVNNGTLNTLMEQVGLITGEIARVGRVDANCLNWEEGTGNTGQLPCPTEWGNYSLWHSDDPSKPPLIPQAGERIANTTNRVNTGDISGSNSNNTYFTTQYHNDIDGAEKGLEWRFAINGSSKASAFVSTDFFLLTLDQRGTLYCPRLADYRSGTASTRLWLRSTSSGNGLPLCRVSRPSDAIANIEANN